MVERIEQMPADTLGFRLVRRLTRDEYVEILHPVREQLERGQLDEAKAWVGGRD